jgi:Domain of unknown function (DUF1996)
MGQRGPTFTSRRDDIRPDRESGKERVRGTTYWVVALVTTLVAVAVPGFGGAQAATGGGQFVVQCLGPVLSKPFDPITRAASHSHEFYGSRAISVNATYLDLRQGSSACATPAHSGDEPGDTASYWTPTLYVSGKRQAVPKSTFYYTAGQKRLPLATWPAHLKILAGNPRATSPQPTSVVYWGCGDGSSISKVNAPPQCKPGDTGLTAHVIFPDCWNGRDVRSPDHKRHMAYSKNGICPSGFPVSLPRLIARFQWTNRYPRPSTVALSSGPPHTLHADFWNAWDQARLKHLVDYCVNGKRRCR